MTGGNLLGKGRVVPQKRMNFWKNTKSSFGILSVGNYSAHHDDGDDDDDDADDDNDDAYVQALHSPSTCSLESLLHRDLETPTVLTGRILVIPR